MQEFLMCNL